MTEEFQITLENCRQRLMAERCALGHWTGELATSALSTAVAMIALSQVDESKHCPQIDRGLEWLLAHINTDGGWGDTTVSKSNINTTALCWGALALGDTADPRVAKAVDGAERWLMTKAGTMDRAHLVKTILAFYGDDRTFSTPILSVLTLMGRLGPREVGFKLVPALPFELAAAPASWWRLLRLPVVSYALPALVAIGQVRHHYAPPRSPILRAFRNRCIERTLRVARRMQPSNGGFLEAIPLTSFVTATLAAKGLREHPIVRDGVSFLLDRQRSDGGWPIDTDLATWVTTLSVNALADGDQHNVQLDESTRGHIVRWLLDQQHKEVHPFTNAAPGGWAWSDLVGAVPDADDTPGALIALKHLAPDDPEVREACANAVRWLLGLQNKDGGIPTFCKGWGKLPFDRSAADITAHTLAGWVAWRHELPSDLRDEVAAAIPRAVRYLAQAQRADGSWVPLWFGNEWMPDDENPTYGTARTLSALAEAGEGTPAMWSRGAEWLLSAQRKDGGWGGGMQDGKPSIEETALAVHALARLWRASHEHHGKLEIPPERVVDAIRRGVMWLQLKTQMGHRFDPAPIGFYFAKLWYHERMYPIAFAAAAFETVASAGLAEVVG
jgi:squalene-hopene/tetraprenyl-beta-curcumene cyclase